MTHIRQESTLQAVCLFSFLFGFNQLLFCFLQFSDIVVNTDQFNQPILWIIAVEYHIHTYPVPLVQCSGFEHAHFTFETRSFPSFSLLKESQYTYPVLRMHFIINSYHFNQWRIFIFTHILIPLLDGISITGKQVQFGITYFGIFRNQQEEVFKITYPVDGTYSFRIVYIDKYKTIVIALVIVYLTYFRIKFYSTSFLRFIIIAHIGEFIVLRKVKFIFHFHPFTDIGRHIRILKEVHSNRT